MVSFDPRDVEQMMEVNIEGTANIVNICLEQADVKLIHVSSIAALGHPEKHSVLGTTRHLHSCRSGFLCLFV